MLLCRTRPLPCKADRATGCNYFAPRCSHSPSLLQKLAMPHATAQATIVLTAFVRSLSADGKKNYGYRLNKKGSRLPGCLSCFFKDPLLRVIAHQMTGEVARYGAHQIFTIIFYKYVVPTGHR